MRTWLDQPTVPPQEKRKKKYSDFASENFFIKGQTRVDLPHINAGLWAVKSTFHAAIRRSKLRLRCNGLIGPLMCRRYGRTVLAF